MVSRKFLHLMLSIMVVASILIGSSPVKAQVDNPPYPTGPYHKEGPALPSDRLEAAEKAEQKGFLPGVAGDIDAPAAQGDVPHYFGPYANYANSPLPKGPVFDITVDSGGSGYTAPVVSIADVYGTGTGAAATATVSGGKITGITITSGGSGYSAPVVSIDDPTGSGAAATATIGGTLSGGIRKFVDSLPLLNADGANNLGQYMPVAIPDTTTYPGADYYEIELGQFTEKLHSDLPPTTIRGYRQTNTTDPTVSQFHYLGPLIVAKRDVPVRIKFTNSLPTGAGGNLFLPVDKTVMGAGMGPLDMPGMPGMKEEYTQNRATLHLHGGLVPWISDGTPHQWITPAGEETQYPKGVSVAYVPDMWYVDGEAVPNTVGQTTPPVAGASNDPGDGSQTFYYNNQQSARLQFYHDHSYGITRLNVYAGEAAGYLITDEVEQDLIDGTNATGVNPGNQQVLPGLGIPLIIQDKTFVDATTIMAQDPTWRWGTGPIDPDTGYPTPNTGDLWLPSVYMPAQNPYDLTGANAFGRWQYGPWFWPPTTNILHGPVPNEYYDPNCDSSVQWCEPPVRPAMPTPSMGMEAFMDTPMVNGTVYPYLEVQPSLYRFRILNAADDRFFNLQMYVADGSVTTSDGRTNTEVKMVPAADTPGFPADWPVDARAGGVPDPATMGPDWIQIGTEGGFLPEPVVIPPQPIAWNMNATAFNVGNVTTHSLLVGTAERADVLVDFSQYAGKTLILYNDAPAAFPALDPRYDYYTGDPNQMDTGGAPTTQSGFGPNTRTIMQIRVAGVDQGSEVAGINLTNGGSRYSTPRVSITGGGGSGATAKATGTIDFLSLAHLGSGYTSAPSITITDTVGGTGAGAAAKVTISVNTLSLTDGGIGYTTPPTVTITDSAGGIGSGATATATIDITGTVTALTLVTPGSNYTAPVVTFSGGDGSGASAVASGSLDGVQLTSRGDGYSAPRVVFSGGGGTGAAAKATLRLTAVTLTDPGSGYTSTPSVSISDTFPGTGSGATAVASLVPVTGTAYDIDALKSVWAKTDAKRGVFEVSQDRVIVPQAGYNSAYNETFPGDMRQYAQLHDNSLSFFNGPLSSLSLTNGGSGYTSVPAVSITGGGGSGATAVANLGPASVASLSLTGGGSGYTSLPSVSFSGGGGFGAAAVARLTPTTLGSINVTNSGNNYRSTPTVTITGGGGSGATAVAVVVNRRITAINVVNRGSGYTSAPNVVITGGQGSGATATARLTATSIASLSLTNGGSGYTSAPSVNIFGGGGSGATAAAGLSARPVQSLTLTNGGDGYTSAPVVSITGGGGSGASAIAYGITIDFENKAIQDEMGEAFEMEYGRMSGFLGLELPGTNAGNQNFFLYGYASPPVDVMKNSMSQLGTLADGTEIWKITHNGVDTHPIHFHLFNVQLLNRVGWDGALLPPDPNELGWKETVRVNPLEITFVAMRPVAPTQPFDIPNSVRPLDPTMPLGEVLMGGPGGIVDPAGNAVQVVNRLINFGWEYVWHCHILSHEEMDMMHSLSLAVAPKAPSGLTAAYVNSGQRRVELTWTDNAVNESGFIVLRSTSATGPWQTITSAVQASDGAGGRVTYRDTTVDRNRRYYYRVLATNVVGDAADYGATSIGFPTQTINSEPTNPGVTIMTSGNSGSGTPFIFASGFEAGFEGWTGGVGNVLAIPQAALGPMGGAQGLAANVLGGQPVGQGPSIDTPKPAYVYDSSPDAETTYNAGFYFHPNGASTGDEPVEIFSGVSFSNSADPAGRPVFGVQYEQDDSESSDGEIRGWALMNGEKVFTEWEDITNAEHSIEITWESGANAAFSLYVDGSMVGKLTGDTSAEKVDEVRLGQTSGVNPNSTGAMYFDDFVSSRSVAIPYTLYLPSMLGDGRQPVGQ